MHREPRRWRTHFGRWVHEYGVKRLARDLQGLGQPVTQKAVYNWLAGDHLPRADRAIAIVRLSAGRVTLDDVFRQRENAESEG